MWTSLGLPVWPELYNSAIISLDGTLWNAVNFAIQVVIERVIDSLIGWLVG